MPASLGVGATLHTSRFLAISGEVEVQNWSDFEPLVEEAGITYNDRMRVATGLEYAPGSRFSRKFFQRLTYRTGFAYDSGFFSILTNEVRSYSGSAGVSFPSPASGSTIDITFMYSHRGQATSTLINENIYTVRVSFNLSELMFLKRLIQ
jgi:long-subunit fatty acid transport protein